MEARARVPSEPILPRRLCRMLIAIRVSEANLWTDVDDPLVDRMSMHVGNSSAIALRGEAIQTDPYSIANMADVKDTAIQEGEIRFFS